MSITRLQTEALQFHLTSVGALARLQSSEVFSHVDAETVGMVLEQAAEFATSSLLPLAAAGDIAGAQLVDGKVTLPPGTVGVYTDWCSLGFPALGMPVANEGLGFPRIVQSAVQELCDGANLAFGMLAINLRCAALALLKNASDELKTRWVPGLISGEVTSTIVISEPQAGSDVGRILTSARPQQDGSWLLTGAKIWISYGDHDATGQILHLVLARVPNGESGTRGLGLFAVPKYIDDPTATNGINVVRLEHKMGLHASPTCVLDLNESRGYLVGEAGRGLQALFVMMNAMRLAVAVQGSAVANAATLHAIEYAALRPQGGHPLGKPVMISEHADVKRMLLEMTAESELIRALAIRAASYFDLADAEAAESWQTLGELLLPIAKTVAAETAFRVANVGIQVLGGYGYTNDYPMERLARDVRVASIYEGTSGIQALDYLKRKVLADKGALLLKLLQLISAEAASGASPFATSLQVIPELVLQTLHTLLDMETEKAGSADDGAYAFLQLSGLLVHAWNGHALYVAAVAPVPYQQRLRASLEYYAASIVDKAKLWAGKAITPLPAYSFPK